MKRLTIKQQRHRRSHRLLLGFMFALMAALLYVGHTEKLRENAQWQMNVYAAVYQQEASRSAQLAEENQALKDKLNFSAKIVTSDVTKTIVRYYLTKYFGKDEPTAEKIFTCESNLNPNALNDKNKDGSTDRGVGQINSVHANQFKQVTGVNYAWGAHDIESNVKFAKWIYDTSGWSPWVCSRIVGVK